MSVEITDFRVNHHNRDRIPVWLADRETVVGHVKSVEPTQRGQLITIEITNEAAVAFAISDMAATMEPHPLFIFFPRISDTVDIVFTYG